MEQIYVLFKSCWAMQVLAVQTGTPTLVNRIYKKVLTIFIQENKYQLSF